MWSTKGIVARSSYRVRIAAVIACAAVLLFDVRWCWSVFPGGFSSLAGYVGSAAMMLVALLGFSIAITPRVAWRALATVFVVAIAWGLAAVLGWMFAACPGSTLPTLGELPALGEFLGELLLLLPIGIMVQSAGVASIVACSVVAAFIAWGMTKSSGPRLSSRILLYLIAAAPVVFLLTRTALWIGGTRPTSGNCAI